MSPSYISVYLKNPCPPIKLNLSENFPPHETSQAMMTTILLDDLLHIIITAITMEGGFGFNRAMLFLVNHKAHTLQGIIGMGPESAEDAGRIWDEFAQKKVGLLEWVLSPERTLPKVRSTVDECVKVLPCLCTPLMAGFWPRTVLEKPFSISMMKGKMRFILKIYLQGWRWALCNGTHYC